MTPAEAIAAADLIEAETAYRWQLAREMYQLGRRHAEAEHDEAWKQFAVTVTRGIPAGELEERRWGPSGRAHFADPRPGDFPGRDAKQPEPETELEACI